MNHQSILPMLVFGSGAIAACLFGLALPQGSSQSTSFRGAANRSPLTSVLSGPTVTIDADMTIGCGDSLYNGFDVTVDGAELTLDCNHTFRSLTLVNGAVVTHSAEQLVGLRLTVEENLLVSANSLIHADGKGYAPGEGPGAGGFASVGTGSGGSHGGVGGQSSTGVLGASSYGTFLLPSLPGSGGGGVNGRSGGGVLIINVAGTAAVEGRIQANGIHGGDGGGSGGSVTLSAGLLTGSGFVGALGGNGSNGSGDGGGGGGRVHIYADAFTFDGSRMAYGGDGWGDGGAGTVYTDGPAFARAELRLDNINRPTGGWTEFSAPAMIIGDVVVENGARLGAALGTPLDLSIEGDLLVGAQGLVSMAQRGFRASEGPGAGSPATQAAGRASGGSHGGIGGRSVTGFRAGMTYGSITSPATSGSGGGTELGGAGGGVVQLAVSGEVHVDGVIDCSGQSGRGGGAGGSIAIEAGSLAGNGLITAVGGAGSNGAGAGAGGGGRIAIRYSSSSFTGSVRANGSDGWYDGGAGSIYWNNLSNGAETVIFDGGSWPFQMVTEIPGVVDFSGDLVVSGAAKIGPAIGLPGTFNVAGSVLVEAGSAIIGDGHGFSANAGPGAAGYSGFGRGSGAGHGGEGAHSSTNAPAGIPYGSLSEPITLGSGGGFLGGGAGGGALHLIVAGALDLQGTLTMNGLNGGTSSGGGSGGSLWIECDMLTGSGLIAANGGAGNTGNGGSGGSGGRVALTTQFDQFTGELQVCGGAGWRAAAAGTILREVVLADRCELIIDNCSRANVIYSTSLIEPLALDGDLVIQNDGILGTRPEQQLSIAITGDVNVLTTGEIRVSGEGFERNDGPGAGGLSASGRGSGGGYGGTGGQSSTGAPGGLVYGSELMPSDFGSGGGFESGGSGGGALYADIGGVLLVDGTISSDGANGGTLSGGGSGGSLYLTCSSLTGTGYISANGGIGNTNNGGSGGGGGRVAIYTRCDPEFDVGLVEALGGSGWRNGDPGSVYFGFAQPPAGDIVLTSSSPGFGLPIGPGTLIQETFELNNGPPPFSAAWLPLGRQVDLHDSEFFRCAPLGIIDATEDVVEIDGSSISGGLLLGQFESSTTIRCFDERIDETLNASIDVDASAVGTYDELSDLSPSSIGAGTRVNSHLLHFDPSGQSTEFRNGTVTFDARIIGVMVSRQTLDSADSRVGLAGLNYPTGTSRRGLDFTDATDAIEIMPDGRTLRINVRAETAMDEVRVITEVPDGGDRSFVRSIAYLDDADEVSIDGCAAGFYRFVFTLPAGATNIDLQGICNVCPQGVVYLNGELISGRMTAPQCDVDLDLGPDQACYEQTDADQDRLGPLGKRILTAPTADCFNVIGNDALFQAGANELIFAVSASSSYWQPTGLEFRVTVNHD